MSEQIKDLELAMELWSGETGESLKIQRAKSKLKIHFHERHLKQIGAKEKEKAAGNHIYYNLVNYGLSSFCVTVNMIQVVSHLIRFQDKVIIALLALI